MSKSGFKHVKLSAISTVVPEKEINIYDEAEYYGGSIKKIDRMRKMVGFHKRRVVDNKTTAGDLAVAAAERLIAGTSLDKNKIDAIVYVVQQPDFVNPANAFYIHNEIGLSQQTPAFDINSGCAGFVYGMWVASQMVESGACKTILLLCADIPSKDIDVKNRNAAPLFGDAGSAMLLEFSEDEIKSYYNIETRSDGLETLFYPSSGSRFFCDINNDEDFEYVKKIRNQKIITETGNEVTFFNTFLDGMAVFDFTISFVPENIKGLMEFAGVEEKDVDCLCLHQANKQIIHSVADAVGFSHEKVPYYAFENFGNNTMCSIPTTICSVLRERTENGKVQIVASGFGNGLTSATCFLNLHNIKNLGVSIYITQEDKISREEYVEYWQKKMKGK